MALARILGTFQRNIEHVKKSDYNVKSSSHFDSKSTNDADALLQKWLHCDTTIKAFLLHWIYSILRQAPNYLQTKGTGYLSAWKWKKEQRTDCVTINLVKSMRWSKIEPNEGSTG